MDGFAVCFVIRVFPGQQLTGQHHVLKRRVLGEQIEVLKHKAKMKPLFANLALLLGGGIRRIPERFAAHADHACVRRLQKVQAAQQRGLAGTGRANDGQRLPFLKGQRDVLEHMGAAKIFSDAGGFQQCHNGPPP